MDQMNQNIDLVNITEFASMLRCSKSLVRLRLTERRQGIGDILNAIPAPLATRPKQRLYWLRSECVRYIERLNATANHLPPQQHQLSPESMMLANRFGLDDTQPQRGRQKHGGKQN